MEFCGILRIFFGITKPQSAKPQSSCGCLRIFYGNLRNVADFCGILRICLRNFAESLNPNRLNPNRLTAENDWTPLAVYTLAVASVEWKLSGDASSFMEGPKVATSIKTDLKT